MKPSYLILSFLAAAVKAVPLDEATPDSAEVAEAIEAAMACEATNSCHWFGGEELCNDRVMSSPQVKKIHSAVI